MEEVIDKLAEVTVSSEKKERRPRLTEEERRKLWEEQQAKKEVLETGVKGTVKWYSVRAKYGFIEREDGKGDVFVHQSVIAASPMQKQFLRTLDNEEPVVFDVVKGDKGPEAAKVTGPDGAEVRGSKFYFLLIRRGPRRNSTKDDKKTEGDKDEKAKKQKKRKRTNRRHPKKQEAKSDEEERAEGEKAEGEEEEAPARRRGSSKGSPKSTKLPSPTASGDASLGAQPAAPAAVH